MSLTTPTAPLAIQLVNPRRWRWTQLAILVLALAAPLLCPFLGVVLMALTGHLAGAVAGLLLGVVGILYLVNYLDNRVSDDAVVSLEAEWLVIATGQMQTTIEFAKIKACSNTYRGRSLLLDLRDGTSVRLRPGQDKQGFNQLADQLEARLEADRLRMLLARPRPRR